MESQEVTYLAALADRLTELVAQLRTVNTQLAAVAAVIERPWWQLILKGAKK